MITALIILINNFSYILYRYFLRCLSLVQGILWSSSQPYYLFLFNVRSCASSKLPQLKDGEWMLGHT